MKTVLTLARVAVLTGVALGLTLGAAAHAQARGRDDGPYAIPVQSNGYGDDERDQRGRGASRDARPYIPLESIIAQIQARYPGRLVGVRGPNGQGMYRIIWETPDGRVITFVVDGRTGQILR
jgi:uncharacterized membrane protein YkoI